MSDKQFTYDWFAPIVPTLERWLLPLAGQPLRAVEVGSFEGRSTCWFFERILTHPNALLICIDTFEGSSDHSALDLTGLQARFEHNVAPYRRNLSLYVGFASTVMPELTAANYDFVFIDGSHEACDVLTDAVNAFRLVRSGGLLLFDDYGWGMDRESRPGVAIDAFVRCMGAKLTVLEPSYCYVVQKV